MNDLGPILRRYQTRGRMANGRFLLVTTVKDEGPHILEWVAWHRLCGFDRILVFQNGSTDLTQRSLRVMHHHGMIEYVPNETGRSSPQIRAYARASRSQAFRQAEWCIAIDADEFFVSHVGSGTVGEFAERIGTADAALLNWRNYGSSGLAEMGDGLTTARFTHTHPASQVARTLTGFKTLFRTSAFDRIGIHNARYPKKDDIRSVNGSGLEDGAFERLNWRCKDPGCMALARINHYPIRDASSFLLKTLRGRGHQDHFADWVSYWRRFERNSVEDRAIADQEVRLRAEMHRMDEISNGRLTLIRRKSHLIWRQTFASAMDIPENRAFHERIVSMIDTPPVTQP